MKKWLEQGTVIMGAAVTRMVSADDGWQIYKTDKGAYVLAVTRVLAERWKDLSGDFGIFTPYDADKLVFLSKAGMLVSSLGKGPFPNTRQQLESFDIACLKLRREHPEAALSGALYIEEKDLILPAGDGADRSDDAMAIGAWITGGVKIPVTDTAGIHRMAAWFPEEVLRRIAEDAEAVPAAGTTGTAAMARDRTPGILSQDGSVPLSPISERKPMPDEPFSLPGSSKLEKFFNEEIVDLVRRREEYRRMGIGFPGAVVLYGPPGTGKTFAVEKLSEYLGWPRYDINSDTVGSSYIHETGMKIARIFDMAISNAPSVVVIDEMESYLSARAGQHQHHVEEVSEFLRKIPEATSHDVLVFGMTNMIKEIDPAILRRGRFDYMIEVNYADRNDIRALLENRKKTLPIDEGADLGRLSGELAGRPMSDVVFVLREAGRYAVKNHLETITDEAFRTALRQLPSAKKSGNRIGFSV